MGRTTIAEEAISRNGRLAKPSSRCRSAVRCCEWTVCAGTAWWRTALGDCRHSTTPRGCRCHRLWLAQQKCQHALRNADCINAVNNTLKNQVCCWHQSATEWDFDCGLYTIAAATSVCYEEFPSGDYDQTATRGHLRTCIERGVMTHFPNSMRLD